MKLVLGASERAEVWRRTLAEIDAYAEEVARGTVLPAMSEEAIGEAIARFDFAAPMAPADAVGAVASLMRAGQVHVAHPRYFGLFNPAPTTMGIAADALVAAFNPQLATQSHAPFAVEAERHVLRAFGERFGWQREEVEGTFTSGGAEANLAAIQCALARAHPEVARGGLRALTATPLVYASMEAHHSFEKVARTCGLGTDAVRRVPVDGAMRMRPAALKEAIANDRAAPLLIVATCGTTSAGAIDPLAEIAAIAERAKCWLHVDAAWGGFAALVPETRVHVAGIERADSITFDAHKALAVPMGAGMFLTRRAGALHDAFRVSAEYMPRDSSRDPYAASPQWSRRFIGAKLLLSLAVAGWDGYAEALREEIALGDALRARLAASGWRVVNDTPLPIVCFVDSQQTGGRFLDRMARAVAASANAWISPTRLTNVGRVLRACITSPTTTRADVDALVDALDAARATYAP